MVRCKYECADSSRIMHVPEYDVLHSLLQNTAKQAYDYDTKQALHHGAMKFDAQEVTSNGIRLTQP